MICLPAQNVNETPEYYREKVVYSKWKKTGTLTWLCNIFILYLLGGEGSSDQVFIDACKGVVQRCIFLLLGVQTSFPVDQQNLTFIQNLCQTRSSSSLSRIIHGGEDNSAASSPADSPSTASLTSQVCTSWLQTFTGDCCRQFYLLCKNCLCLSMWLVLETVECAISLVECVSCNNV